MGVETWETRHKLPRANRRSKSDAYASQLSERRIVTPSGYLRSLGDGNATECSEWGMYSVSRSTREWRVRNCKTLAVVLNHVASPTLIFTHTHDIERTA